MSCEDIRWGRPARLAVMKITAATGSVGVAVVADGGRGPVWIDHTQANNTSKSPSAWCRTSVYRSSAPGVRLLFVAGKIPPEQRDKTRQDLLDYCERATEAMVELLKQLREMAGIS